MNCDLGQKGDAIERSNSISASWVIREAASKRVICETFDKSAVERLNTAKYEAVPILAYLVEVNASARNEH